MRLASFAALILAVLCSGGCLVVSLQPFYDEASVEFDEALLGDWVRAEDGAVIRVDRGGWKSYKIVCPTRSGPVVLAGFLTRIGDSRALDLTPGRPTEPAALFIPVHIVLKLQVLGDALTVTGLDYEWFLRETGQGRLTALGGSLDGRKYVVLTAETAGLRAWMAAQSRGGEMFGDAVRFVRKPQ